MERKSLEGVIRELGNISHPGEEPMKTDWLFEDQLYDTIYWLSANIMRAHAQGPAQARTEIEDIIKKYPGGSAVLEKVDFERAMTDAKIRRDWAKALQNAKSAKDLSEKIGLAVSLTDLKILASLHKNGEFRKEIEALLNSCEFHEERSDFKAGRYEKY